jgi:hypothetical protein
MINKVVQHHDPDIPPEVPGIIKRLSNLCPESLSPLPSTCWNLDC